VIDVDPEIHAMLQTVLDPVAWTVRHAPNNTAALTLAGASHFDLIITSDKTSGREDVDLLRKIRRVRPHTRLIILTDESAPSYVIDSMRERAFSYFSKPFSLSSLSDMIQHAIDSPCWDDGIEILSATRSGSGSWRDATWELPNGWCNSSTKLGICPSWKATLWVRRFAKFF
jgi:DNA-binding NarL/FixJ family response regulator